MFDFVKKKWTAILLVALLLVVVTTLCCLAPFVGVILGVAGFLGGFLWAFFCRLEASRDSMLVKNVIETRRNYYKEVDKISEERDTIILVLKSLNQRITIIENWASVIESKGTEKKPTFAHFHQSSVEQVDTEEQQRNPYRLFSGAPKRFLFAARENAQRQELSEQLHSLMWSYPRFDATQRNDLNYLIIAKKDLVEHHSQVLAIKDFLFDEVHQTIDKIEQDLKVSMPKTH